MALAEILASIRSHGEGEVARIEGERDAKVAAIMEGARRRAEEAETAAAAARDDALATDAAVVRNRARLQVERRLREAQEELFQELLGLAEDRLSRIRSDPRYPAIMGALLDECTDFLGAPRKVIGDPRDQGLLADLLADRGDVEVDLVLESWGGLIVSDGRGASVRNTIRERLRRAEAELRTRIGGMVEGLGDVSPGAADG